MKKLTKKYQIWAYVESGYHLTEFDDLNELPNIIPNVYTDDFFITQKIDIRIIDSNNECNE